LQESPIQSVSTQFLDYPAVEMPGHFLKILMLNPLTHDQRFDALQNKTSLLF